MIDVLIYETDTGLKLSASRLMRKLLRLSNEIPDELYDVLVRGALVVRNEAIEGMRNSPPTGKMYGRVTREKIRAGGQTAVLTGFRNHIASSPGNPPRIDFGRAAGSIDMDIDNSGFEVGSTQTNPPYPFYLEEGTKHVKARPWLGPVFDRRGPMIWRNIDRAVREAVNKR